MPPAILTNTLAEPEDVAAFVRAIRRTREIAATAPLAEALGRELHPGPAVTSDADLESWVRTTCATTGHAACGASTGTADTSVLDECLRVRGVEALRVADASAFPRIPRANTNAAAIPFGERCADFIKEDDR